jgi:large subunit ribosomal protein L25
LGDAIYVKDIPAPANVEFLTDGEELVVIATAQKEEAVEEEEEIAEVTGEGEPEVIEHGKKEEEEEE